MIAPRREKCYHVIADSLRRSSLSRVHTPLLGAARTPIIVDALLVIDAGFDEVDYYED